MEVREPSAKYLARSGYKQTEVGVIPEVWESTTVRDLASPGRNAIVGGPFGSDLVSNDYVEDGVPVVRGQNMGCRFVSGRFAFVSRTKASSLEANLARPGDLVFTQRGTLGQVSLVPNKPYDRYLISQSQMKLTVNRKAVDPLFFYYVFSSTEQQEFIRQNTIQTGVPHINLGILRAIPVQRPSLAEQEAIAEALSDADALIESLEQLLVKKCNLKQGAMQELLTGKKRLPGFSGEWELVEAGDIGRFRSGNGFPTKFQGAAAGEYPFFKVSDMNNEGNETFMETANNYISETLRKQLGAIAFPANSIVLAKVGAAVFLERKKILVKASCLDNNMAAFVLDARLADRRFIHYLLLNTKLSSLVSTTALPSLSGSVLAAITLVLPPITEQTAIAAILSDMDAEIAALEAKLAKARNLKQGMMQELLTGRIRLV